MCSSNIVLDLLVMIYDEMNVSLETINPMNEKLNELIDKKEIFQISNIFYGIMSKARCDTTREKGGGGASLSSSLSSLPDHNRKEKFFLRRKG